MANIFNDDNIKFIWGYETDETKRELYLVTLLDKPR